MKKNKTKLINYLFIYLFISTWKYLLEFKNNKTSNKITIWFNLLSYLFLALITIIWALWILFPIFLWDWEKIFYENRYIMTFIFIVILFIWLYLYHMYITLLKQTLIKNKFILWLVLSVFWTILFTLFYWITLKYHFIANENINKEQEKILLLKNIEKSIKNSTNLN